MTRIEDESARMGVLVEDLLALARLDEVRDQHREPVDMARLAGDAVDDARAVAPEREIELHTSAANGSVVLDGDPSQLRQVLANLMRNALVHTPAGTPIEVTVAAQRTPRGAPGGPRPRAGPADRRPRRALRALLARGSRTRARAGGRRASACRSWRRSSPRTAGAPRPPTPPAAARASPSRLPLRAADPAGARSPGASGR